MKTITKISAASCLLTAVYSLFPWSIYLNVFLFLLLFFIVVSIMGFAIKKGWEIYDLFFTFKNFNPITLSLLPQTLNAIPILLFITYGSGKYVLLVLLISCIAFTFSFWYFKMPGTVWQDGCCEDQILKFSGWDYEIKKMSKHLNLFIFILVCFVLVLVLFFIAGFSVSWLLLFFSLCLILRAFVMFARLMWKGEKARQQIINSDSKSTFVIMGVCWVIAIPVHRIGNITLIFLLLYVSCFVLSCMLQSIEEMEEVSHNLEDDKNNSAHA